MGIPLFFKILSEKHGSVIIDISELERSNNLFIDMNCLLHPCCKKILDDNFDFGNDILTKHLLKLSELEEQFKALTNNFEEINFKIDKLSNHFNINLHKIPSCIKVLLENLLRYEDGISVTSEMINNFCNNLTDKNQSLEIAFYPTRVLMQDFTGVPAIADLAAMREALKRKNINPNIINPLSRVDLIIDHSVMVDSFGSSNAYAKNIEKEFKRNKERYEFLKWGQNSFDNFYLVPPGAGICHQVNLESIAKTVWIKKTDNGNYLFPDSVVGTDSHTTMINALSVLGWGVGGIEAEAAMLGQPISMNVPKVIGFQISDSLNDGITATDLVLNITEIFFLNTKYSFLLKYERIFSS